MNGIIPKAEKKTQTRAVSRKPSRFPISFIRGRLPKVIVSPAIRVSARVAPKTGTARSNSSYINAVANGINMKPDSMTSSMPMTLRIMR